MAGNKEDIQSNRQIAALNLKSKNLDWLHTFIPEEIGVTTLEIQEEKLYALWGKELLIFE